MHINDYSSISSKNQETYDKACDQVDSFVKKGEIKEEIKEKTKNSIYESLNNNYSMDFESIEKSVQQLIDNAKEQD